AHATARDCLGFEHFYLQSALRKHDRGPESVRPRSHNTCSFPVPVHLNPKRFSITRLQNYAITKCLILVAPELANPSLQPCHPPPSEELAHIIPAVRAATSFESCVSRPCW